MLGDAQGVFQGAQIKALTLTPKKSNTYMEEIYNEKDRDNNCSNNGFDDHDDSDMLRRRLPH